MPNREPRRPRAYVPTARESPRVKFWVGFALGAIVGAAVCLAVIVELLSRLG